MRDGPDTEDVEGAQIAIIPSCCPYCADSPRFSIRTGYNSLDEAVALFANEERGCAATEPE